MYADCIKDTFGVAVHHHPGAGAAGGAAAGLMAFLDGKLKPGITIVTEALHLEPLIQEHHFDLLLTGEGKIDGQTASGKVVAGLSELAQKYQLPVIALAGAIEGDLAPLHEQGLTAALSITTGPMSLETAMHYGTDLITKQTEQIYRMIQRFYK